MRYECENNTLYIFHLMRRSNVVCINSIILMAIGCFIHVNISLFIILIDISKVKFSRYRPGVAQSVGRGIAALLHDRGTGRW